MKRQTLLSAARPCSLPPRGIILFFDLSNNAPARLAVTSPSSLPDVSIIFHTFLTPTLLPPPANDSLYLMASTRHANFPNIRILTHTPCTHLLLWLALCALQIWVRRPASLEEAGNGWWWGGEGGGGSYHMTAAPRIKRQRQPPDGTLKLPSQLSKINHTKRRRRGGWGLCWKYTPSAHTVPAVE